MLRVAALQFATVPNVDENLATCLRLIDQAASRHRPDLLVLPEVVNHVSWYADREQAAQAAVTLDGPFLKALAERAHKHRAHLVVNCTVRRAAERVTVTSLMFGPEGTLLGQADKQLLVGPENEWFVRPEQAGDVVDTDRGRVGFYTSSDGLLMETARCLALRGAQVLCASLGSFGLDHAALHVPARAFDNRVFVVAANKVGPLVPPDQLEAVAAASHLSIAALEGAGESQIVSPRGEVLAKAPRTGEAIVFAELEPAEADDKTRRDGSSLFGLRRPELYRPLAHRPRHRPSDPAAAELAVACVSGCAGETPEALLEDAVARVAALAREGIALCVLPELFCFPEGQVSDPEQAAGFFREAVRALALACGHSRLQVATSLVEAVDGAFFHMGALLGPSGIIGRQPQLHVPARHAWARPGRRLDTLSLPWGRLTLLVGEDCLVPELAKLAALNGSHLIAAPFALETAGETAFGLPSRAAENRLCIAAATRSSAAGTSTLYDLEAEFTLLGEPWAERSFDGALDQPLVTTAEPDRPFVMALLHPSAAENKLLAPETHLLERRVWWLADELTRPVATLGGGAPPEGDAAAREASLERELGE